MRELQLFEWISGGLLFGFWLLPVLSGDFIKIASVPRALDGKHFHKVKSPVVDLL